MINMLIGSDDEQGLVLRSFSKIEIEQAVQSLIELHLENTDSGTLFLFSSRSSME